MKTLIIPGLNGSGPEHWQRLWEEKYGFQRVDQRDWGNPDFDEWVATLNTVVTSGSEKAVLVAHSLGCLVVAGWAKTFPEHAGRIHCALLVAPPDVEGSPYLPEGLKRFDCRELIPFSSLLVGSENDHYMALDNARKLAGSWNSRFFNAGAKGHINLDSGHGPWPQGERLLEELMSKSG